MLDSYDHGLKILSCGGFTVNEECMSHCQTCAGQRMGISIEIFSLHLTTTKQRRLQISERCQMRHTFFEEFFGTG